MLLNEKSQFDKSQVVIIGEHNCVLDEIFVIIVVKRKKKTKAEKKKQINQAQKAIGEEQHDQLNRKR